MTEQLVFYYIAYSSVVLIALTVFFFVKLSMVMLEKHITILSKNSIFNIVMFLYILASVIYFLIFL